MNTELALSFDLSPINSANLSPKTRKQYEKAILKYLGTGAKLGDAHALKEYALTLPTSSRAFLKAGIRLMSKGLEHDLKSNASPENLPAVQSALYRLEALQDSIQVKTPKGEKVHVWLNGSQVKAIMGACGDDLVGMRDWIVLGLFLGAGVRCDELVNLKFDDLIELPMPKNGKRTCLQVKGKGEKTRTIPLKPVLAARLEAWREVVGGSGYIVRSLGRRKVLGERMCSQGAFQLVRKYGEKIGMKQLDPHDLRRTWAQLGYEAGVPITQISTQLGHSSVKTTQRYLNMELDLVRPISDFIPLD